MRKEYCTPELEFELILTEDIMYPSGNETMTPDGDGDLDDFD